MPETLTRTKSAFLFARAQIVQYNYNVLKTLKTCCLASGTAHRHRQAELNRHSYNEISFYVVKMKKTLQVEE